MATYFCWPNKFSPLIPTSVGPTNPTTYSSVVSLFVKQRESFDNARVRASPSPAPALTMTLPGGRPSRRRSCPSRRPSLAASPPDGVRAPRCGDLLCFPFSPTRAPFSLHLPAHPLSHGTLLLGTELLIARPSLPPVHYSHARSTPPVASARGCEAWCPSLPTGSTEPLTSARLPGQLAAPPPMAELVDGNKKEDVMWVIYVIDC